LKSRNTVFHLSARYIAVLHCETLLNAVGQAPMSTRVKKRSFEPEV